MNGIKSFFDRIKEYVSEFGLIIFCIEVIRISYHKVVIYYYKRKIKSKAEEVGANLQVNGKSSVTRNTILGNNVNFNGMTVRGGGTVTIGDNFHSGPECLILSQNHNYDDGAAIPYDSTYNYHEVKINNNVWLGARVTILPGVEIGEGAIIQAGSTVADDIPKCAIAGGHPASVFKWRDIDHYEKLKSEGKFL